MRGWLLALVACGSGSGTTPGRGTFVMRVDRALDRAAGLVSEREIPADRYVSTAPVERWEVTFDGPRVTLVPIAPLHPTRNPIVGTEVSSDASERRFSLDEGTFAGGRFVVRGERAEVTIFGSGVPVISSELGALLPR